MDEYENRQKLNKYIKEKDYDNALELLESTQLSSEWCHLAVAVYVALEKECLAEQTIVWAKENTDLVVWRRCIYEYVKMCWGMIWGHDQEGVIVLPGIIAQKKKDSINEILKVMQPVLLHIEGDSCVSSELEAKILLISINALWLLGDIEKVRKQASYFETKKPASIELANLAMMGLVKKGSLKSNFPERLNNENPDSFNAKMLSQLLKAEIFGQSKDAFESLKAFALEIKDEERLRYCQGLFHVAQLLGKSEIEECIKLSEVLLGEENSFCKLAKAEYLLNSGKIDNAEEIVKDCKDENNPQWLQIYAFIQLDKKNYKEAVSKFEKASKLMAHPEVFATLARLATKASEKDDKFRNNIIDAYKSILDLQSDNLSARHNLALELARSGRLQEAKEHFKYLTEHSPDDIVYKQNYANCLMYTGNPGGALGVYNEICKAKDVSVETVIVRTELLKQVEDTFIAFDFLQKYRKDFWNIPSYLQCYMKVSSQANQDGLMHEALLQIKKLQSQGKASPDIVQEKTLDDLIEHGKQWNERTRQIHDLCLKGKIPWTLADDMLNYPIYTGWSYRTQKLNWVSEEPAITTSNSVYATNVFLPLKYEDGKVYLQRLEKPQSNSEVVMDITALITLHRLCLLDKAKDFFKTIYVPTLYLSKLLIDSDKLQFHQYSDVKSIREIKKSIDNGKLGVLNDSGTPDNRPFPYINEHTLPEKEEEHFYRLIDIINVLEQNSLTRKNELDEIKKITLKPTGFDKKHPEIEINDTLIIEIFSLKTICNFNLYDTVLDNFDVKLSSESKKQVLLDFSNFEHQKKLQEWNKNLHDVILSDSFKRIDVDLGVKNREEFSLAALKLLTEKNLPLYSDDRVIQVAALNVKTQKGGFGTDVFIEALYSQKHIDIEVLTNVYLQLIDWRYKFVIPPLEVLIYLAEQYSTNPPGTELKKIAMYAHDCMRDPGLFCGLEKTADVPLPMAMKLYMEWLRLAIDFVVKCWTNTSVDDEVADKYTDWTILYFLPTVPKYLTGSGSRLASMTKRILLGTANTQLISIPDINKGNEILRLLKRKLELSDVEYKRIVWESIDAQSDIDNIEEMSKIKKVMVRMAFKHQRTVDYRDWAFLKMNKMSESDAPITDGETNIFEILSNKNKRKVVHNNGPLLIFGEHDKHTVVKITDLIFTNKTKWRKIVYDHFIEMQPGQEIGYITLEKLRKIEAKLLSDDWIQEAVSFYDLINADWLCNLMGLQQANEGNFKEGLQEFATDVFRPSIASLESIGVGVLQPSYAKDGYIKDFRQIYEETSDLCDLLDRYYYKYGHMPLCYEYSLYSMLDSFFAKHSYNKQKRWDSLWQWTDTKESPLSRYHVCCYFVRNSNNVPEERLQTLYDELLNIIHMPVEEDNGLQWASAWKLRYESAKHFGQFLESRLPGANSENIYSQAWWMAEKVASIYGNSSEGIDTVRKYTISTEGYLSNMIWQTSRPMTQNSSLRYATLRTGRLWTVSVFTQLDNKFLEYIYKTELPNKELFVDSLLLSLVDCFPLKPVEATNSIYAYDVTCIKTVEHLSKNYPDTEIKQKFSAFLSVVKQLSDPKKLIEQINIIFEHQEVEQFITAVAMSVMAYTDLIENDNELWENVCNENWLEKAFLTLKENVVNSIINSFIEIILQKQDKWAWQLPHLFSIICQKHISNDKVKDLTFACVVISSICSETCSALKRTLITNKADISELRNEWNKRLQKIYQCAPDYTKSRLRPAILCLNS